jgi:cellulose synthase/poly-beta-1,6-N-acetylglucosamine synthase-like glycosyltransferase
MYLRRALWERAGGWHQEFAPGEDAEFWTRGLSVGFNAERITEDGLFHYRIHANSASRSKTYVPIDTWLPWMRDKKYPLGAPTKSIVVNSYMTPKVSVIVPVGPSHAEMVEGAIRSLLGQSERSWELLLIDNTRNDDTLEKLAHIRWPFTRYFHCRSGGVAAARNIGLASAQGDFVLFLDADDYLAAKPGAFSLSRENCNGSFSVRLPRLVQRG